MRRFMKNTFDVEGWTDLDFENWDTIDLGVWSTIDIKDWDLPKLDWSINELKLFNVKQM